MQVAINSNNSINWPIYEPLACSSQEALRIATRIPRIVAAAFIELAILPLKGALLFVSIFKSNFDPQGKAIKKQKVPILLLHGTNSNEMIWIFGRKFLNKANYGSVFSLNYDGLVSNDPKKGIDDYAKGKVTEKIREIKNLTGSQEVILMGHSMGGLVASYYAEHCAAKENTLIKHIFTIATPWQGTPVIDIAQKFYLFRTKRHTQMNTQKTGERHNLLSLARASEDMGKRKYYNIWSTVDQAVPSTCGKQTKEKTRQHSFSYLGHNAIVAWPAVWSVVRSWLDQIYN